ncbi:MAG: multiheme c-type cytochrome [Minwuia sp.]|uniref:multiheme c-type cytochrome n=1 Tax=Minwuia sp. TaxID=2493630 RepID=UPI003A8573B1
MFDVTEHRSVRTGWLARLGALAVALVVVTGLSEAQAQSNAENLADQAHTELFTDEQFPSASKCASCHEAIYKEWASSNHAYASISPMFHKFEQAITNLTQGTIGTFCVRCHQSVGTTLGESRAAPLWERSQVSREGITCITCHRVKSEYYKANGERRIEPGQIYSSVYTNSDGEGLKKVIEDKSFYRVATNDEERGNKIHTEVVKFEQISKSEFCASCHQVAVNLGIKLEVVWDQYRDSPALEQGITCQECHMGKVPGTANGYAKGPAAVVNGEAINPDRDRHNHAFYGPGYPIAHPGIFPHNPAAENWTMEEWLQFDYRSGWGTEEFEDKVYNGEIEVEFPEVWSSEDDRFEARYIIEENLEGLEYKKDLRRQVMENGSHLDGPFFAQGPRVGQDFSFNYTVENINPGHNLPSGSLGAQPEIWLNVAVTDPDGNRIWESGYVDSDGDMADLHSKDVQEGTIEHDDQLFNLQTKFLTTNLKGTDREMFLPVSFDIDQRPFLRQPNTPTTVLNHPAFIRMEGRSIPPLGKRDANYTVPGELLTKPGTYKISARMRSRAEPIYFMRFVGATKEMEQSMNQWMLDMHPYTVEVEVQ